MTQTYTKTQNTVVKSKSTPLGLNMATNRKPIGIVSYNTSQGRVMQCEVFTPFWENTSTVPDKV